RILLPSTILLPPTSPLFPYTTLFRSPTGTGRQGAGHVENAQHVRFVVADRPVDGGQEHPRGIARAGAQFDRGRDAGERTEQAPQDRKSTRLNSSHVSISYAVFCLKKK